MQTVPYRNMPRKAAKGFSILLLIVFFLLCAVIGKNLYDTWRVKQTKEQLSEIRLLSTEDWSRGMLAVNPDYVGWLTVYGADVDGPVVQGENNNEYLRSDIYGEYSAAGTFFMDERVNTDEDGNVIIYGHMMKDNTMFGGLKQFRDSAFFKQNGIVRWEDVRGEHYYKLFAAAIVSGSSTDSRFLNIQQWANVISEEETETMLDTLKERSYLFQENPFQSGGQYIFLVTCDYSRNDGRLVLVGRRM